MGKSKQKKSKAELNQSVALYYALSFLVLTLYTQLVNLNLSSLSGEIAVISRFKAHLFLLFRQNENILVAGLFYILWVWIGRLGWRKLWSAFTFFFVSSLVLIDQLVFRVFHDHFNFSLTEGGLPQFQTLMSSILSWVGTALFSKFEGPIWFGIFSTVGLAVLPFLTRWFKPVGLFCDHIRAIFNQAQVRLFLVAWIAISFDLGFVLDADPIEHHPFSRLVWSVLRRPQAGTYPCGSKYQEGNLYSIRYGIQGSRPSLDGLNPDGLNPDGLNPKLERLREPPNLILIVLESVGSEQLIRNGLPDRRFAPHLMAASAHSILFDRVYNTFPATIRTHIPIQTGGKTLTWGSVYHELNYPYIGPTLVGEFKKRGYSTALFSAQDLGVEGMRNFYQSLPWDEVFGPERMSSENREQSKLNSWGVQDSSMARFAQDWAERQTSFRKPYFLQFLTVATHHPYTVPQSFRAMDGSVSLQSKYENAISYLDEMIGDWIGKLEKKLPLENTIVAIMGDHGEAFGEVHFGNSLHKSFLYEENIRNFLMIYDPHSIQKSVSSAQIAYVGDVAPTLVSWIFPNDGSVGHEFLGQNLIAQNYEQKIRYFHKNADPEQWGLVDGNFKFISRKTGKGLAEIYDLERDPLEHHNLAEKFPDRVEEYDCLCRRWYLETNAQFVSELAGASSRPLQATPDQMSKLPGPIRLLVGPQPQGGALFRASEVIRGTTPITVIADWIPDFKEKKVTYEWVSPTGKRFYNTIKMNADWTNTTLSQLPMTPMEVGIWKVGILKDDGKEFQIETSFRVE